MIISAPGYKTGNTSSMAELVDVYPTISKLVGFDFPDEVQGKSLLPVMKDPKAQVRLLALTINKNGMAIRGDEWAYMRYSDQSEELYSMSYDPNQFENVASSKKVQDVLNDHRLALELRINEHGLTMKQAKKKKQSKQKTQNQ